MTLRDITHLAGVVSTLQTVWVLEAKFKSGNSGCIFLLIIYIAKRK